MPETSPERTGERPYHHGNLRTALLDAAEASLREHGVDQLSLRELARQVGVSHAAPRRHFPDRQALLDALATAGFERLGEELRAAVASAGRSLPARLGAAAAAYSRFATRDVALLELMFTAKHQRVSEPVVAAAGAALTVVFDLVAEGQEAGVFEPGDLYQVGTILFATIQGIVTFVNGGLVPREMRDALVETAVEQFLRGSRRAAPT
ncbi:TetR/AcrR family transcriptional regulator [Myceligenerans indicum]|uniref:TetR/AcrR family transcriptional regulator n=1 Tax=Myceligenerans indicum TaxID=2593663 RepID=UPI0027DDFDCE|nr:TetR/AcrR family transcriptional regulator [Myceligenerans indicum]